MFDTVLNSFNVVEKSFTITEYDIDVEEILDNNIFSIEITKNACLIIKNYYINRIEFKDMKDYLKDRVL
jgi:serine/threonine-protein kinase RIO1